MRAVLVARDRWRRRIPTAVLNRWLRKIVFLHPPPRDATTGGLCTLKYLTQIKRGPPEFRLFVNHLSLPADYQRRAPFDLERRECARLKSHRSRESRPEGFLGKVGFGGMVLAVWIMFTCLKRLGEKRLSGVKRLSSANCCCFNSISMVSKRPTLHSAESAHTRPHLKLFYLIDFGAMLTRQVYHEEPTEGVRFPRYADSGEFEEVCQRIRPHA